LVFVKLSAKLSVISVRLFLTTQQKEREERGGREER